MNARADEPVDGRAGTLEALTGRLAAAPWEHDFFDLLRRLEALHPELPRLGRALRPSQEPVRLGQDPELDFAPAALSSFQRRADAAAPRLGVRFFGLLGPQGPLPLHITEHVRERLRFRADPTTARFLDVFHHRMLSLFYRAWADHQPTVQQDRPGADRYAAWLGASFGEGPEHRGLGRLPTSALLFQAGLLGGRSRHPEGLEKLIGQHFGVPVRVESNVAQWLAVEREDRTPLGRRAGSATPAALGRGAIVGSRRPDRQSRFRLVLGPLTRRQYASFVPPGAAPDELREWVLRYTGLDLRWDVRLVLRGAEVPEPRLGCSIRIGCSIRLGVDTWIGRRRPRASRAATPEAAPADRGELRLRPGLSFLHRPAGGRHA